MWSNFLTRRIRRAAALMTAWSRMMLRCGKPAGKGDIAVIDSAQDQTLHQMTSRVLRERPRNRPQLSEDCEAGPHKSRDMRRHCQVPVEDKTEITDLVLRLNSIRTN